MDDDIYADLKAATYEEMILSVAYFYEELGRTDLATGLRMAVRLIQPDAWQYVAPAWLRRWRTREVPE